MPDEPTPQPHTDQTDSEKIKTGLWQVIKFGLVGVSNTVVDFAVLNILVLILGVTDGVWLAVINVIAFAFAVTNSYLWNKFWTFKQPGKTDLGGEISKFLAVSVIGAGLNTATVYLVTTFIEPMFGLSDQLWVNVGKILATVVVLAWNFVGYKFWAFRSAKKA